MKTITRASLILLTAACLAPTAVGQADSSRYKTRLEPVIKQILEKADVPGFAIAVVENRKVVYAAGFGVKNLKDKSRPITPQSLFHMASITKPFVATSIMQLWEQGKINLDDPVSKHLPYFRLKDDRAKAITLRQMLSHISGMPDVEDYEWDKPQYDAGALERYVRSLTAHSLIAEPGARFQYSNMAYEVLGDVIAKVSGESFEDYVRRHILDPLGMKKSTLIVKQADPDLLTSPHVYNDSYDVAVSPVFPYNRMHAPSSTLISNVLDMSRWAIANLNRGELDGKRILKASTYDLMWKPASAQFQQIGISWFLQKYKDHSIVTHSGGDLGFLSNLVLIPDRSIAVVMMTNFDRAPMRQLTNVALDVALGLEPDASAVKPSVARVFYKTMVAQGIDAAVQKYYDLKKNQGDAYNFQEPVLNELGYNLMNQGKVKEAIRVFQLNVEAYPSSSNVYDSLGEAYMRDGYKAKAIENYEKSLKLDPANTNAAEMLKKLKQQ